METHDESHSLTKFENLIKSMECFMQESCIAAFKDLLFESKSQESFDFHLSYFVKWLSERISDRKSIPNDPFFHVLTDYLMELPLRFDRHEVLLVLSGLIHSYRGKPIFTLWLIPIANCLGEDEKWRFPRIAPILNDITASIALQCKTAVQCQAFDDLSKTIDECLSFYSTIIEKIDLLSLNPNDARVLQGHLLFFFAQPLSLIDFNCLHAHLFTNSIRLYRMVSNGLFTSYNEIKSYLVGDFKNPDIPMYITVPAWIRLLTYIRFEADPFHLKNCWPLVFSPDHYLDLMHIFIVTLLDEQYMNKFINCLESHCYPSLSEEVYIRLKIRAIEVLHRLISTGNFELNVSWWFPQRTIYIKLLKVIATQPISTEKLPDIVSKSIHCIDSLLKMSTYTAQCELFYELLPPKNNEHHGFRGHLITLCKDSIHNCWVSVQKSGIQHQLDSELSKGEEIPQLPVQKHVLSCLCEMIFAYPHVASTDSLVDQSSWILAAANMALYIFIRSSAVATTDPHNVVLCEIIEALLRMSDKSSRFFTNFFQPLKKDLESECDRTQATVHTLTKELKNPGDSIQKRRLESSLAAQEATLLRLRLLQVEMFTRHLRVVQQLQRSTNCQFLRYGSYLSRSKILLDNECSSLCKALSTSVSTRKYSASADSINPPRTNTATSDHADANATFHLDITDSELRTRVLESALRFVPTYGWSRQAVEAACQAEGLPSGLHSMAMPQGAIDLVLHFYASRNQQLAEAMSGWRLTETTAIPESITPPRPSAQEVDEFLYRALKFRLEAIVPVLSVWPQALGLLALPSNVPSSVGLLAQLVDEVWAQAGDRSTDMTWYAKRLGLAYVYNLTEVYMLQDKSPDLADSWVFLRTRLSDLRSLKQMNLKAVSSMLRDGVFAFGNVTCNILGLARRR